MPRDTQPLFGVQPVRELLRTGAPVERVHVARGRHGPRLREIEEEARRRGIPVRLEARTVLDRLAGGARHQGVVAVAGALPYSRRETILSGLLPPAFLLILDGVEDPRNLGALLRTAAATGVQGVFVPERRAVGLTPGVVKASSGYAGVVPVVREASLTDLLAAVKDAGIWTVAVEVGAEPPWKAFDFRLPVALLLGGEAGIRPLHRRLCDTAVGLPLAAGVDSLNVSVAFGAVAFEVIRQRGAVQGSAGPARGGGAEGR